MAELNDSTLVGNNSGGYQGSEDQYLLSHDATELVRLTRQHELCKFSASGQLLSVPIPDDKTSLCILDVGCANGLWLSDLPAELPGKELSLHGVDLVPDFFPFAPKNTLDLRTHNLLTPIPTSWGWDSTFDIIHQRFLVFGYKKTDWPLVLRNLFTLLKPGGYVQLVESEWNPPDSELAMLSPLLQKRAEYWSSKADKAGMDANVGYKLTDLLGEAGYESVEKKAWEYRCGAFAAEGWRLESAQVMVQAHRALGEGGVEGVEGVEGGFAGFLDALEVEIRERGYMAKLNYAIGRKPVG